MLTLSAIERVGVETGWSVSEDCVCGEVIAEGLAHGGESPIARIYYQAFFILDRVDASFEHL